MSKSDGFHLHFRLPLRILFVMVLSLLILGSANVVVHGISTSKAAACGTDNIGGIVFQDYNADGIREANEGGVPGVAVTAYDSAGAVIAITTTITDGTYVLNVPNGTNVRVEFTGLPAGFLPGPHGPDSSTLATFVTSPDCNVSLGVNKPSEYSDGNPTLATNQYIFGNQLSKTLPVLVSFPYSAGGTPITPTYGAPAPTTEANSNQIGTTWGLGYQRASNSLFAAAFMKRHAGFGSGGTGAIYRINRNLPLSDPNRVTVFVDLNTLFGSGTAGVDPHPSTDSDFAFDSNSFDQVGKIALGDLDVSEDDQTIWTINLADRQLYRIPIGIPPVPPTASRISRYALPLPTNCPDPVNNSRPFATGIHDGLVYVGMVCSAQTAPITTNLRAYVYAFDPNNPPTFNQVLNFPLNYPRLCADRDSDNMPAGTWNKNCSAKYRDPVTNAILSYDYADWQPWVSTFQQTDFDTDGFGSHPQPMLADIVFDHGDMILGFRDRFGDQVGYLSRSTNRADPRNYIAITAGDILRACADGSGGWSLENNATCGTTTTTGANNHQGPGLGEYYFQEHHPFHDEDSNGGLAQVPGFPDIAETAFDPIHDPINGAQQLFQAGVLWFDNGTGDRVKSYRIYAQTPGQPGDPPTFGKANGLGDLEAMSGPAPLEIGNRVWWDQNGNGIQDAGEQPLAGVTVHLYINGTLVATTTTNALGEYYFTGLLPNTTYTIALDNPADYADVGPLHGLTLTQSYQGTVLDNSKGTLGPSGLPQIVYTTGGPGANDHNQDFGFVSILKPLVALSKRVVSFDRDGAAPNYVTFTISISNIGPSAIEVLPLEDQYDPYYLSFVRASPMPDEPADDGTLNWYDLTAPPPNGFNANLATGQSVLVTTVFSVVHDITTTVNTATTSNAVDIFDTRANDATDSAVIFNAPTAVSLLYFRVDGVKGRQVRLAWATAVEVDDFGFNLYRADTNDFSRAKLIHFEPAAIQGHQSGATYIYADAVPSDNIWWYWLADVDTQGNETLDAQVTASVRLNTLLPYHIYLPIIVNDSQ